MISRRHLLRGSGIAVALPLLEAMSPRRAAAADQPRRRFLAVVSPNGTIPELWFPTGEGSDFAVGAILTPLERHRADLLVFKGIENKAGAASVGGGGHGAQAALLTGRALQGTAEHPTASGISLDQQIAELWARDPRTRTPYRSLELGTSSGNQGTYGSLAYAGPGMPLPKIGVAKALFDRLFSPGSPDAERQRARRASLLDRVREDYLDLQAQLGAEDRVRLDAHIQSMREIELRLARRDECGVGALEPGSTSNSDHQLPQMFEEMLAVWVLALACDQTRVVTYMFRAEGQTGGSPTFPWLGIGPAGNLYGPDHRDDKYGTQHHTMSHFDSTPENRANLLKVNRWFMEQVATLVDRLKATPDGPGRTLFDGTVVLYGSAIGQGNHTMKDIPFLLLGNASGAFRTGRYLKLPGVGHNELLTSILHALGGQAPVFGDPRFARGPLAGLT